MTVIASPHGRPFNPFLILWLSQRIYLCAPQVARDMQLLGYVLTCTSSLGPAYPVGCSQIATALSHVVGTSVGYLNDHRDHHNCCRILSAPR